MRTIFGILASAISIYSLLIFIRIILSWFGNSISGKPLNALCRITDPYLIWWRKRLNLRVGILDLSAVTGIVALSVLQNIFYRIYLFGYISLGVILSFTIMAVWSVVSFVLFLLIIIIVIRLIGYIANVNIYGRFWQLIDSISQPVLYRINRIIFGKRIPNYLKGIIFSLIALIILSAGGSYLIPRLASLVSKLPF